MDMVKVDIRGESKQILRIFEGVDLVTIYDLLSKIEELDDKVSELEDKYKDLEQDLQDNYKPIPKEDQYDIHDCYFN